MCCLDELSQAADINLRQRLGLHFQIHLGVDVRGVQRHMAQPSADRVDINTCTQQMDGCRVPDRMRADTLRGQGRYGFTRHGGIVRHDAVYPEPGQRLLHPSQKDCIVPDPYRSRGEPVMSLSLATTGRSGSCFPCHEGALTETRPVEDYRSSILLPHRRVHHCCTGIAAEHGRAPQDLYACRVDRGAHPSRPFRDSRSRLLSVFLNGIALISEHQARWTGERMPMKCARE